MDTAQGTFQLSTLPFATLHDVVHSYPFFVTKDLGFLVKKSSTAVLPDRSAAGFALARTVLYLSNFNGGVFNGYGQPL